MSAKGQLTGMAGEFAVMERLYRLGHQPALTLSNAKTVDILTKSPDGKLSQISVKAMDGQGKWGIGKQDYTGEKDLFFVFVYYRKIKLIEEAPEFWIMPSADVMRLRKPWLGNTSGIYRGNASNRAEIEPYKNRWDLLEYQPKVQYIAADGGNLVRTLVAIGAFHDKYNKWPVTLALGNDVTHGLQKTHLTLAGFEQLNRKVDIERGPMATIVAKGDDPDQFFNYSDEECDHHNCVQKAMKWLELVE